jgi:hypothetical protein
MHDMKVIELVERQAGEMCEAYISWRSTYCRVVFLAGSTWWTTEVFSDGYVYSPADIHGIYGDDIFRYLDRFSGTWNHYTFEASNAGRRHYHQRP